MPPPRWFGRNQGHRNQVEELRKSLAIKRSQLEAKDAEANEKLKRMVVDQQEAEQKKAASIEIQAALVKQGKRII